MTEQRWVVPLSDLLVDAPLLEAVNEAVASKWWSMGPRVAEFEGAFADFCGARHAIAVANGTAALHIALLAMGCGQEHEVILPSLNFVAAANVVLHVGATPVFCDVSTLSDLNLDPGDVEAAITPSTRAIVVLHYGGYPCDIDRILDIARRHDLVVIEDAAHAIGATTNGRMCGTIGEIGCFSFFSNKNLPVGEGGMVVTNDDALASQARLLRSHGMTTLTWERHRGHASSYDVVAAGFNYRLDEVRAAIGLVQLRRMHDWIQARGRVVDRYRQTLDGVHGIVMPFRYDTGETSPAHHLAVALLPSEQMRDHVRSFLADRKIQTSLHYPPIHAFSHYSGLARRRDLRRTEEAASRLITLPLYGHMTDAQADLVTNAVIEATADGERT
jgi:dTDP-4-amino-4,6-dideoxygalactose transaminase